MQKNNSRYWATVCPFGFIGFGVSVVNIRCLCCHIRMIPIVDPIVARFPIFHHFPIILEQFIAHITDIHSDCMGIVWCGKILIWYATATDASSMIRYCRCCCCIFILLLCIRYSGRNHLLKIGTHLLFLRGIVLSNTIIRYNSSVDRAIFCNEAIAMAHTMSKETDKKSKEICNFLDFFEKFLLKCHLKWRKKNVSFSTKKIIIQNQFFILNRIYKNEGILIFLPWKTQDSPIKTGNLMRKTKKIESNGERTRKRNQLYLLNDFQKSVFFSTCRIFSIRLSSAPLRSNIFGGSFDALLWPNSNNFSRE